MFKETIYRIIHAPMKFINTNKKRRSLKKRTAHEKGPKIIVALTPEYGNMGDQIIALAEIR